MADINELLSSEIEDEFEGLKKLTPGSKEHEMAVTSLTALVDKAIEVDRVSIEADAKAEERKLAAEAKEKQLKHEKRDSILKAGVSVIGIIVPAVLTAWGVKKSFEFEKEGTITTMIGRGFINKLLPKK